MQGDLPSSPAAAPAALPGGDQAAPRGSMADRWMMADVETRARLLLRALAWVFSLISLLAMATDMHGGSEDFNLYSEYNYCLAAAIIAFVYALAQIARDLHRLGYAGDSTSPAGRKVSAIADFAGDQVVAYLLISGLSAATPVTDYMRAKGWHALVDASGAAIAMAFLAFVALALSALLSGHRLSLEVLA